MTEKKLDSTKEKTYTEKEVKAKLKAQKEAIIQAVNQKGDSLGKVLVINTIKNANT